ncbi:hypothetical protein LRS11_00430 [Pseudomonas sp. J452]|uniref:hypothetical protein n=1 Tax=Pseudomonas sp. J452 TaxID=2898441 RepID=UPI0021ADE403|nr:hypothetical protein [Pseudomonas sp. J452]UUY08546.1 hypothetical protein LRS11_00430 [Pseudomonas sp. J452]
MPRLRLLVLLLLGVASKAGAQLPEPVRLDTSFEEPYQLVVDGELGGLSVKVLECIFGHLQRPYQIQLTSLQRARLNVSREIADGFFSSAPNRQVDGYAVLSAPLLIEKWYWYALDPSLLNRPIWDKQLRIGSVLGSNSMSWIESRGIAVEQKVPRLEQLVELLQRGRINMLLADANAMGSALELVRNKPVLHQRFVRYSPLGVYFSRPFLQKHPDFLEAFNRQVESCAPPSTALSQAEQDYLRQLVSQHLRRWGQHADLLEALRKARQAGNSAERIQELDRQWRQERTLEEKPLIRHTLNLPGSQLLVGVARQYAPLFNELFVSDGSGQLVALSEITSDYWQADEVDFQRAVVLPAGEVHIGAIEYDGSTQSFQSKVSAPIHDAKSGTLLGVISLGINIETAFGDNLP